MKTSLVLIFVVLPLFAFGQAVSDHELITLKNGYQIIGKVIEMQPGISITVQQSITNDTLQIAVTDIERINRVIIGKPNTNSADSASKKMRPEARFNKRKFMFQFSYNYLENSAPKFEPINGGSVALFKSYNNRFYIGGSAGVYYDRTIIRTATSSRISEVRTLIPVLIENKLRLALHAQQKRASVLLSMNFGYTFNDGFEYINFVRRHEGMGAITMQSLLGLRINFDEHSGYTVDVGATYMPLRNKLETTSPRYVYHGHTEETSDALSFSLRVGYFF